MKNFYELEVYHPCRKEESASVNTDKVKRRVLRDIINVCINLIDSTLIFSISKYLWNLILGLIGNTRIHNEIH